MSQRWLVTGARGFLGGHVCAALSARDIDVLPLDHRPPRQQPGLVADLTNGPPELVGTSPEVVVHLAGLAHREATTEQFEHANVLGTEHLLQALEGLPKRPETIVLASSVAVYGRHCGELLDETTSAAPLTPYGASKLRAEEKVSRWAADSGSRAVVLRLPLLVGAQAPGNLGRLISALRQGRYLGVGPGSARRSMVRASDVAAALLDVARYEGTFHLTDGQHPSFRELEESICRHLGRRTPFRLPLPIARLLGRVGDIVAGTTRLTPPVTTATITKMTHTLTFDDTQASHRFGWSPSPVLEHPEQWVR